MPIDDTIPGETIDPAAPWMEIAELARAGEACARQALQPEGAGAMPAGLAAPTLATRSVADAIRQGQGRALETGARVAVEEIRARLNLLFPPVAGEADPQR